MRYTRSYARAQAALLQPYQQTPVLARPLNHLVSNPDPEVPTLPSVVPEISPSVPVITRSVSILHVANPLASLHRPGLPIPSLKKKQERYGVALRVQCVTLAVASIPLDTICQRWHVTKSAIYR